MSSVTLFAPRVRAWVAAIAVGLATVAVAAPQGSASQPSAPAGPPQGAARDAMWWAPTAEDWRKPVPIVFQRTWEDALAVAQETGKPILICVNMDGEPASEHYAGVRYRQPETAKLYEPYVCVIASTYRHTERDHDEHGHRILCPRFGSVTCGEHIAIEPILFEKFFEGRRVSPRHIMVELDGSEKYDVYYAFDTASVFQAIREGIEKRTAQPKTIVRGDRPILERVASRDVVDRNAVEQAYQQGDAEQRRKLLAAAKQNIDQAPIELLRLAVHGFDPELAALARAALARAGDPQAAEVIDDALRVPVSDADRKALLEALARLGERSPRAKSLAVVHGGAGGPASVDVQKWVGGASYGAPASRDAIEQQLAAREGKAAGGATGRLELAEARLALALNEEQRARLGAAGRTGGQLRQLMLEDARRAAQDAERQGARSGPNAWRLDAVLALCAWQLGEKDEAYRCAKAAAPGIPAGDLKAIDDLGGQLAWNAVATLSIFAEARHLDIVAAAKKKKPWPAEWLQDVSAAYSVLAQHALGTDVHVVSHFDLLWFFGARARATKVLDQGLTRFPSSPVLHDRLRTRVLRDAGANGLLETYDRMLAAEGAAKDLPWFAGYAAIVAAEFHRRHGRAGDATAAYEKSLALFDRAIEQVPAAKADADHYAAIGLAGLARIALQADDHARACERLLASFERCPTAGGTLDGLGLSAVDTARALEPKLRSSGKVEEAERLAKAVAALPAVAHAPPEFEQDPDKSPSPDVPASGRQRRR